MENYKYTRRMIKQTLLKMRYTFSENGKNGDLNSNNIFGIYKLLYSVLWL